MSKKEWPINPSFLSLRKDCKEDMANYNNDGIYYTDYIRGFLADLSHDREIQNALSIFQFVPTVFLPQDFNAVNPEVMTTDPKKATVILNEPLDEKAKEILERQEKKIIRIDSGTFVNNGRLCDAFRDCNLIHTSFCFRQDSIVAIFADEELNTIDLDLNPQDYHKRLELLIDEFNEFRKEIMKIKYEPFDTLKRFCIHYTCPFSLFEEHIFPIYLQGRVIACLMLGQMGRDAFDKDKSFINKRKEMEKIDPQTPKYFSKITKLDEREWKKKAEAIIKRIIIFEKRLEDRIDHRNTRYINNAFSKIEQNFRLSVKNIKIKKQDAFTSFTKALNDAFTAIRVKFDDSKDGFIRMFALPIDIKHEELVPIGWSGAEFGASVDYKFVLKKLKDLDKLSKKQQEERIKEAANSKIKELYDEDKDILLPGWLAGNEVAYIVWKRHDTTLKNRRNRNTFKTYKRALKNFYSVALECYSYIRGTKMELLLETTIQEHAHESTHFILPAIDVVEKNLDLVPPEMIVSAYAKEYNKIKDSYDKYREEVLESLNQLREINYGSSLIFSSDLQINKKPEKVFYLLYKLKKLFNNKAMDSNKTIDYEQTVNFLEVNIDAKYFNHALYNLLDNAIKYGYEGSYIHIYMDVDRQTDELKIKIVSYGIEIEENDKDRIYNLFERSEEATKMAKGTGIGMYIVRKICEAHGGKVFHKSDKLSDYNIPVLYNFKSKEILSKKCSKDEIDSFRNELRKLSISIEQEVVCDYHFVRYSHVFSTRIKSPTFKNTFYVTIPLN